MNDLDDLIAVLDDRAHHGDDVRPDLGAVRTRARRRRRAHQTLSATAAVTAVGLGAGVLVATRSDETDVVTADATTSAPATSIVVAVPLSTSRTLSNGDTVTATVTAPLPTYGPYGEDHLWYPPPSCPADARLSLRAADALPDAEGFTTITELPITAPAGERRAYRTMTMTDHEGDAGSWTALVMVTATEPGERYRLTSGGTELDTATGEGQLTVLVGRLEGVPPRTLPGPMTVERLDADGHVVERITAEDVQPDAIPGCESVNQGVESIPSPPPGDSATADAAVRDATRTIEASSVALTADQSINPIDVHWTSPTSAWVKYQVVYFAATPENGNTAQGPYLWAEVTFDGASWQPTAEARCAYAKSRGTNDPCTDVPPVVPMR